MLKLRPVIGVTTSFALRGDPQREQAYLNASYTDAVYAAGGLPQPIAVPTRFDEALLQDILAVYDGVIFTGGLDLDPAVYGETPHPRSETLHPRRNAFEIALFRAADAQRIPILAICLGHQVAHVARGGRLIQHVPDFTGPEGLQHARPDHSSAFHDVAIAADSRLAKVMGMERVEVNSRHHQAVQPERLGAGLRTVARAADGIVEASEDMRDRFLLTVQWHPEDIADRGEQLCLFETLMVEARRRRG